MPSKLNEICSLPLTERERLKLLANFFYDATIEEMDHAFNHLVLAEVPIDLLIGCLRYSFPFRGQIYCWNITLEGTKQKMERLGVSYEKLGGLIK